MNLFVLDGLPFHYTPQTVAVRTRDLTAVRTTAAGTVREYSLARPGWPARIRAITAVVTWDHVEAASRALLDRLLARPGAHTLTLATAEEFVWAGDGASTEFLWPARHAGDVLTLPVPVPVVTASVGRWSGHQFVFDAALTVVEKTSGDYAAGTPAAGELWRIEGGRRCKLAAALPAGDWLHVSLVPLRTVRVGTRGEERHPAASVRQPRQYELVEELTEP